MNSYKRAFSLFILKKFYSGLCLFLLFGCNNAWVGKVHQRDQLQDQKIDDAKEVVVAIRPEYQKSKLHQAFFGRKYRDLWAQPVKLETIDVFQEGYTIRKVSWKAIKEPATV